MISVSGKGLVCVHDLNSLLVPSGEEIKFKTTKLIEGAKGGRCAVTRTPENGYTFLCAVISMQLVLMQWYVDSFTLKQSSISSHIPSQVRAPQEVHEAQGL